MPRLPEGLPPLPDKLRPYTFLGLDLDWVDSRTGQAREHALADCPWCGRDGGKFTVTSETGLWGCFVCGEKGNALTFLRKLWDESDRATNGQRTAFAAERGLLYPDTLDHWGACKSVLDGAWLVPAHDPSGKLCQLYKRVRAGFKDGKERWEMRPTPTLGHAVIGMPLFDRKKPELHLHESWGNALAFWEALRISRWGENGLEFTASQKSNLLANANVLAVANCGAAGEPLKRYLPLFAGKRVTLWFDSDHPVKQKTGRMKDGGGLAASKRVAGMLAELRGDARPESVSWCRWGPDGFDPDQNSGWDVRDGLTHAGG